jgi:tRNA(Ile2) C34 agmatinyltransferase TiaS
MSDLDLEAGAQPRCPSCGVLMRDVPDGVTCPECGYHEPHDVVAMPPEFSGPTVRGG